MQRLVSAMKSGIKDNWFLFLLFSLLFLYACFVGPECIFLKVFHVICPGCGMTRAVKAVLHLDMRGAWMYHPMVYTLPILGVYILKDGRAFRNKYINAVVLSMVGVGFLINYILKLAEFL